MAIFNQLVELFYLDTFSFYGNVAVVVGSLYVVRLLFCQLWQLLGGLCALLLAPWGISRVNLKKYGPWAVVTGASEGIGRGYALELARLGLNVVIMSRSLDKLQRVANEIKEKYSREVRTIAADFSEGPEMYPQIFENLQDLDIGVLVNNVGCGQGYPEYFTKVPQEQQYRIVQVNCHPVVQMTHMLLPKMVHKKRGVIVNISSGAADFPLQLVAVYSSTKKFNSHFSDALRKEYSSKGIIVQDVKPLLVATALSGVEESLFVPDATTYAGAAVATIGIQHTTHGYFYHALQSCSIHLLPRWLLDMMMWKGLQKRADELKKKKYKQK